MRFKIDDTLQQELFAFTYRDLVAKDSDVLLYLDLFETVDTRSFESIYSGEGQVPIEPKLMLRTIFYGLTHGVVSGRKIQTACRNDNRFIVLSGNLRPDRRTFDRFLDRHIENIKKLFSQIVMIAKEMGLVKLGHIAIDGSRFKANTSVRGSVKYEKMERAIKHIEIELDKLREDLKKENSKEDNIDNEKLEKEIKRREIRIEKIKRAKEKIEKEYEARDNKTRKKIEDYRKSLNDSDAQGLAHKSCGRGYMFGYNTQAAVEESNQIIVAAEIHDSATDYEALPKLLDDIEEEHKEKPDEILADKGYKSVENLKELEKREMTPYIAVGKNEYEDVEEQLSEQLKNTGKEHEYRCMNSKIIPVNGRRKDGRTDLRIPKGFCDNCEYIKECKLFGKKTASIYMPKKIGKE